MPLLRSGHPVAVSNFDDSSAGTGVVLAFPIYHEGYHTTRHDDMPDENKVVEMAQKENGEGVKEVK